jgi:hypothetical protein
MLVGLRRYGVRAKGPKPIAGKNYKQFEFDAVLHGYLNTELHWAVWEFKLGRLLDPYRPRLPFRCTSFIEIDAKHQ